MELEKKGGGRGLWRRCVKLEVSKGRGGFLGVLDGVSRIYIGLLLGCVMLRDWRWYGWGVGGC